MLIQAGRPEPAGMHSQEISVSLVIRDLAICTSDFLVALDHGLGFGRSLMMSNRLELIGFNRHSQRWDVFQICKLIIIQIRTPTQAYLSGLDTKIREDNPQLEGNSPGATPLPHFQLRLISQ